MLEYIVDKIIEKEITVNAFTFGINGLSYSEELVKGLNKLRDYIIQQSEGTRYCPGLLMVSQDQFHKIAGLNKFLRQYYGTIKKKYKELEIW